LQSNRDRLAGVKLPATLQKHENEKVALHPNAESDHRTYQSMQIELGIIFELTLPCLSINQICLDPTYS